MFYRHCRLVLFVLSAVVALAAPSAVLAAAPTFSTFSPTSGKLGTTVTITGSNFVSGGTTVSFNGTTSSSVTVVSSTKLTVGVPLTASTGKITIKTSGGSVTGGSPFTVVPGLIASASSGPPTISRTLYYSGFGTYEAVDFYFDTDDVALASASSTGAGNVPLTIPADAVPGTHYLTAVGRHTGYSGQITFLVRADYAAYGFSANHQANNIYENVLDAGSVPELREAWRTPKIGNINSVPTVASGVVYAAFNDGTVRAFDENTGAQKWSFPTGGSLLNSSPAVSGGIVYVGSDDSYLYALNAATGAQKWRYGTGGSINGSPAVSGGRVYVGSSDNNVYALNAATGALVWNYATGAGVYSSPAVAQGVVYVGSQDKNFYAFDAATGALKWQYTAGDVINASPVLVGGLVCFGADDKIMHGLRASTGSQAWGYTTGGVIGGLPAVGGSTLFFGSTDGKVYALSAGGVVRWSTALPSGTYVVGQVCTANGIVYASDFSYTYAFSADTGTLLTTLPVGSGFGGPSVVNGAVLSGDYNDGVVARYLPNAAQPNFVAPRPEPAQLVPHPLP